MRKRNNLLTISDIKKELLPLEHPYKQLQFELLPVILLLGNQVFRQNIRDPHLLKEVYRDKEFPQHFYLNLKTGFNYKVPLITESFLITLGWKGGTAGEMISWRQETARFLTDCAKLVKLVSDKKWTKRNIMNPGTLSLRLLLGVNLWKAKGKIPGILSSVAKDSSTDI